jgi:aspartyl-tRNA(Asn)/glutamyl-tRNA(Gln) amidotransferase subunit A
MQGYVTRRGTHLTEGAAPDTEDSPAVSNLKAAGCVILGKTATTEYGWKGIGDCPLHGPTRNPWSLGHTAGGSSSGAAASVAAGFGPLAIGTDGGGSVRIPSSFTGGVGLKATFGAVPVFPPSPFGQVSHVGPMTRTVLDAALMLDAMAKPDPRDWFPLRADPHGGSFAAGIGQGVKGLKIAFNDIDFCLKLRAAGLRNVWTPFAELYHHESVSRGSDRHPSRKQRFERERAALQARSSLPWRSHLSSSASSSEEGCRAAALARGTRVGRRRRVARGRRFRVGHGRE